MTASRNPKKVKAGRSSTKDSMTPKEPPTKIQKKVIHWVRRNVPTKKTKFLHSHVVEYFTGMKAVDALVNDSPWNKDKDPENSEIIFDCRETAIDFMDEMLKHKMFHRAKKIPIQERVKQKKKKKSDSTDTEREDKEDEEGSGTSSSKKGGKEKKKEEEKEKEQAKKKKRKIRLDMHLDQVFVDSQDAFVWLYDPIPWYYWAGGSAIVLGIIAICLFPLWPPMMRQGVHYLSIAATSFLGLIIALVILKYVLFAILFALTGGKLKFWIFPNLTEDVGFFESFVPLYDYTYIGGKVKAKDSDDEEEDDEEEEEGEEREESEKKETEGEESDDSTSRKSSTGKDFEIVDKEENENEKEKESENE